MSDRPVLLHPKWLSTADACAHFACSRRTLQRRANRGEIQTRTDDDGRTEYCIQSPPAATSHRDTPRQMSRVVSQVSQGFTDELRADKERLLAEVAELRAELAERPTNAELQRAIADVERMKRQERQDMDRIAELGALVERADGDVRVARAVLKLKTGEDLDAIMAKRAKAK